MEQLTELADLGLSDFAVERIVDTARDEIEFYALLRRLPRDLDATGRAREQQNGIRSWSDVEVAPEPEQEPITGGTAHDSDAAVAASLSPAEARLVRAKRRLVHAARTVLPGAAVAETSHNARDVGVRGGS